jgi:hypothetical protein
VQTPSVRAEVWISGSGVSLDFRVLRFEGNVWKNWLLEVFPAIWRIMEAGWGPVEGLQCDYMDKCDQVFWCYREIGIPG